MQGNFKLSLRPDKVVLVGVGWGGGVVPEKRATQTAG